MSWNRVELWWAISHLMLNKHHLNSLSKNFFWKFSEDCHKRAFLARIIVFRIKSLQYNLIQPLWSINHFKLVILYFLLHVTAYLIRVYISGVHNFVNSFYFLGWTLVLMCHTVLPLHAHLRRTLSPWRVPNIVSQKNVHLIIPEQSQFLACFISYRYRYMWEHVEFVLCTLVVVMKYCPFVWSRHAWCMVCWSICVTLHIYQSSICSAPSNPGTGQDILCLLSARTMGENRKKLPNLHVHKIKEIESMKDINIWETKAKKELKLNC